MDEIEIATLVETEEFLPSYGSDLAAGADVRACIAQEILLEPGTTCLIPTGLRFAIPDGYEIQVRPRSGLALKSQITVLNSPGTIDADYRGELGVILINHGKTPFIVTPGMRIAQIVVAPVVRARFKREDCLIATSRGEGGFGHTGTH
ncbi:MAG: dUTP diphosphatase [Rhabdochlamydiaceae bacterium]|nr:dUTP diphosphatase [Rhabdochlamydiaceae bacterium]